MRKASRWAGFVVVMLWLGATAFAGGPTRPPTVEIPAEHLELAPGDPLSGRALVTKPLPLTGVMGWTLESRRHRGAIWRYALSPDGRSLATGGLDGTIRIWDVESGKLTRALIGHNSYVSGLDWSPDGNTLASAGTYDITVRLWDTRTGRPLRVLKGHPAEVTLVSWAPDGKTVVASGGQSGALSCWNAITGFKRSTPELGRAIVSMSWHPDGKSVALVGQTLPLQIWDAEKNKVTRTVGAPKDAFLYVAWDPEGKLLAGGTAKETQIFDGAGGKLVQTLPAAGFALAWAKGSKRLATMQSDGIKIWDVGDAKCETTIAALDAQALAVNADFSTFITGASTSFSVHDRATAKTVRRFENLAGTEPPLWLGGKIVVTGIGALKLTQWDIDTGKRLRFLEGHTGPISAVAVAPTGKTLATASHDKTVRLWETATGKLTQTFAEHKAAVLAVAMAPDGKTVASADADKKVLIWDAPSAKVLRTLSGGAMNVTALAWKPGSSALLLSNGEEDAVTLWHARTGKIERHFRGTHEMASVAWSPDGARVAGGQRNGDVLIWQEESGRLMHTLKEPGGPPDVTALAWSPRAQAVAAGRGNHTMQLWEPKGGKKLFSLPTMAPVVRVSWTGTGLTVGVSSQDRTVRFFDAVAGKLRGLLLAEDDQLMAVHFDGHYRAPVAEGELVYVVQRTTGQETYTPSQFAARFKLKNAPAQVNLFGK